MNRFRFAALIIGLFVLFAVCSQAIVRVKMLELRVQLAREQLLNYELSSRMLRAKFRQLLLQQDNYATEIKMNILESSVMNFEGVNKQLQPSYVEIGGLWIVNIVRVLSLKSFLKLQEDQDKLLILQFAFYLERTHRYDKAAEKYGELVKIGSLSPEDNGFVLLHYGYCLGLTGKAKDALVQLRQVESQYPGTHYAENAIILIGILLESEKRAGEINASNLSDAERGVAFYNAGLYAEAIDRLTVAQDLVPFQNYALGRSFEETGQTPRAIAVYQNILAQAGDEETKIKANRRLLMIGSFYGGGSAVTKQAEQKAAELGDTKVAEEVREGVAVQLKPVVVEMIQQGRVSTNVDTAVVEQLASLSKDLEETLSVEERTVVPIPEKPPERPPEIIPEIIPEIKPEVKPEVKPVVEQVASDVRLTLIDGRTVYGDTIQVSETVVTVTNGKFSLNVPFSMVGKIHPATESEKHFVLIDDIDGTKKKGRSLVFETGKISLITDSEPEEISVQSIKGVTAVQE